MAERVGFEPTVEFPLHTLSKRAPSTTRTSLRIFRINGLRAVDRHYRRNCVRPPNVRRSLMRFFSVKGRDVRSHRPCNRAASSGHERRSGMIYDVNEFRELWISVRSTGVGSSRNGSEPNGTTLTLKFATARVWRSGPAVDRLRNRAFVINGDTPVSTPDRPPTAADRQRASRRSAPAPTLVPPLAAITTYCLPSLRSRVRIGDP